MAVTAREALSPPTREETVQMIEKEGYKLAAIIEQDEECALFVSIYGRAHTAWFGHDKKGNRRVFVDDGFLAVPHQFSFDE